jgi:hypothetical protein
MGRHFQEQKVVYLRRYSQSQNDGLRRGACVKLQL